MEPTTEESARSWLKPFLKPLTPVFREVVAMSFFVNLLALAVPIFTMQVYNRVVGNNGISTLQGLVVGMILVIFFDYILRQSRARILQTVALRVDVDLGRRLFRKIMRVPLQTLEIQPSAYWSSLFRDVDMVRNTLSGSTALLVADLPFAILFLVVIFVIAAPVAWVLLVMLPVFMFVAWRSSNVMSEASGQERKSTQSRDALVAEMIAGRTTIKALALDRSMEPVWEEKHAENIESAISRGSKTDGFSNIGSSLGLLTSLLLTTVGALAIIDQQLTMGALIATNMLSGRIMGPLNQLVGTWRLYSGFLQATERLGKVFLGPSEREVSEIKLKKPRGALSIENVIFSYSPDLAPVVSGITVDIAPGGVHALVGRNGSGKTTLLKLIQGLYQPQKGRVTMDGADIAQFTRSELADWLGYVPQESVLFAGTVRDNIISRMPNATDEEVIQASTEAGVHQFIIDLPDGYATEIGEAGGRLSGGQRQRIAIARALVGNPPVVLLDEPSSSLDRHAETELKNTLVEIAKTRTVIMVSHSPTLLSACDFLYALDRGKLALSGPAREVLPRLFGGKPPPPKGDGPKTSPKGPNGGPGGEKPHSGYEAIMAKAGLKSSDAPSASAAPGSAAPMHTATPQKPAAKLKAPAKLTPIEKAALAQASATQAPAAQASIAQAPKTGTEATPKPKVKAAAMARGKAPRMAKSTASSARTNSVAHPSKSVSQPHAHQPHAHRPTSAANATGPILSKLSQPTLRVPGKATNATNATLGGVHAGAQLRSVTPVHKAVAKSVSAPSSLATPSLRSTRGIRARANLDLQPAHKPAGAPNSAEHAKTKIKAGAALRPTTKSILNTWAEGSIPAPSTPRKGTTSRGTGARTRSTPTVRLKGPVGE